MRFLYTMIVLVSFTFNNGLSGDQTPYQRNLEEYKKNPPPQISEIPGGDKYQNIIMTSVSDVLRHLLSKQSRRLIMADDYNNETIRQQLWIWYGNEYARLSKKLNKDDFRAHFKSWAEEYFNYFIKKDFQAERQNYLEKLERERQFGDTTFYWTESFEKIEKNITSIRDNVAKQHTGSPELYIIQRQDEAENFLHNKVIEAMEVTSPDDARNYLNWSRVRETMSPMERWSHLERMSKKRNAITEQHQRELAYQAGGDSALQQLVLDIDSIKTEISSLREEVGEIKKHLGKEPDAFTMSYVSMDKSTEARLFRVSSKLDKLIEELNFERSMPKMRY